MPSSVFSALFDTLPLPVFVVRKSASLPIVSLNRAAKAIFLPASARGRTRCVDDEESERPLEHILRFRNLESFAVFSRALADSGVVDGMGAVVLSSRGMALAVRVFAGTAELDGGEYCVIHLARENERQTRRSEEIFRTVVDNLEEFVYITDLDTYELKFVSRSIARSLGRDGADLLGRPCWDVIRCGGDGSGPGPDCPLPRLLARGPCDSSSLVWEFHDAGTGKWYLAKNNIVDWIDGTPVHLSARVDISYRKQYEEQLKRFAATDAMTDVYNRKWGRDRLKELFSSPEAGRRNRTLCFLDLDGLKRVNDTLGHAAGDEMIINAIQTTFSCIRKDDFIIRWGGDEFVLFLNCGIENAEKVLGKIAFGFEHFNSTRNRPYRISVSAGLVCFAEPFGTLDDLLAEADRRMYANKLAKRGRAGFALR